MRAHVSSHVVNYHGSSMHRTNSVYVKSCKISWSRRFCYAMLCYSSMLVQNWFLIKNIRLAHFITFAGPSWKRPCDLLLILLCHFPSIWPKEGEEVWKKGFGFREFSCISHYVYRAATGREIRSALALFTLPEAPILTLVRCFRAC